MHITTRNPAAEFIYFATCAIALLSGVVAFGLNLLDSPVAHPAYGIATVTLVVAAIILALIAFLGERRVCGLVSLACLMLAVATAGAYYWQGVL